MSAEEAKEYGLVDEVLHEEGEAKDSKDSKKSKKSEGKK